MRLFFLLLPPFCRRDKSLKLLEEKQDKCERAMGIEPKSKMPMFATITPTIRSVEARNRPGRTATSWTSAPVGGRGGHEEQCVDQRKDGGIRADSQGERKHRDDRETGILAQDTNV